MTGIEARRLATGGVSYVARVRRQGVKLSGVFSTPEEAQAWRSATLAALRTGGDLPEPPRAVRPVLVASVTVADACRELVRGMRSGAIRDGRGRTYKHATTVAYESRLRLHVLPYLGAVPVAALRRGDVQRLVEELSVVASPRVAVSARDVLRVVLRRQLDLEVIPVNVCDGVRVPTPEDRPARFLTPEEADRLQAAADADCNIRVGALVALALATGMRRRELQALPWGPDGLDLTAERVRVAVSLDGYGNVGPTKTRKVRFVPLGPATVARLRRYRLASGRPGDGSPVFCDLDDAWVRVREAAGLADPQPRFHDLRHTAATFMLAAGLRSHAVAQLLGHEDAGLVDRRYGHALPSEVAAAGDAVEAWFATRIATGVRAG